MRTGPQAHYVRHNKVTRVPRSFVYLDSEATRTPAPRGEVQTFRCAVAAHDRRRHDKDVWAEREWGTFTTPAELWAWIDARTQARARCVVVAHNLAYDLRITDAFTELPALGWTLGPIRLDRGQAWCTWTRDGRTLALIDSMSWLPVSLEKIGELVQIPKLALPAWDDTDAAWLARCTRDVEILADACRRLWQWIRSDDLGNWKPTGAGQSWAAYRHRFMEHSLLAHTDTDARAAERVASWTGRCEVWQHGRPRGGPFTEWDWSAAYGRIGAECDVPVKLIGGSTRPTFAQWQRAADKYAVLAEVEITTEVPTVPCRVDGRICWPVGTFTTTLWENEVQLALDTGAHVTVTRCWWYKRAPALRKFCEWVLAVLDSTDTDHDQVIRLAMKHWSRALIGRFGARWSTWERCGTAPTFGLSLGTVIDSAAGDTWRLLHVGHELKRCTDEYDSPDAVVAVMSWVMAECRRRLWQLTELAGHEHVIYMDTDSVIVNSAGSARIEAARVPDLRMKGTWATCELLAPRQLILAGRLRAAGVPRDAVKVAPSTWQGEVWTELATSLRAGEASSVRITTRRVKVHGKDARRLHLDGGGTEPRRLPAA